MADYDPDADLAQLDAAFAEGLDRADHESCTVLFDGYSDPTLEMIPHATSLGANPEWADHARALLAAAATRGREVRDGRRAYRSDRLFSSEEVEALQRAMETALILGP